MFQCKYFITSTFILLLAILYSTNPSYDAFSDQVKPKSSSLLQFEQTIYSHRFMNLYFFSIVNFTIAKQPVFPLPLVFRNYFGKEPSSSSKLYIGIFNTWFHLSPIDFAQVLNFSMCSYKGIFLGGTSCLCLPCWNIEPNCSTHIRGFAPIKYFPFELGWIDLLFLIHVLSIIMYLLFKVPFVYAKLHFFDNKVFKGLFWPWIHPSFLHSLYSLSYFFSDLISFVDNTKDYFGLVTFFIFFHATIYLLADAIHRVLFYKITPSVIWTPIGGSCFSLSIKIINSLLTLKAPALDLYSFYVVCSIVFTHIFTELLLIGSLSVNDILIRFSSILVSVLTLKAVYSPAIW